MSNRIGVFLPVTKRSNCPRDQRPYCFSRYLVLAVKIRSIPAVRGPDHGNCLIDHVLLLFLPPVTQAGSAI